jgi:hypothetical protein
MNGIEHHHSLVTIRRISYATFDPRMINHNGYIWSMSQVKDTAMARANELRSGMEDRGRQFLIRPRYGNVRSRDANSIIGITRTAIIRRIKEIIVRSSKDDPWRFDKRAFPKESILN